MGTMRVLVVDDEQLVRWFLERALKKLGHEVISASSSSEALRHILHSDFDVLFTDLRMPEENGTHLLKKVSEIPDKNPKIVVCSAFITAELADEFKKKGIFTLKKPFKLAELENTLKQCSAL
jgi:DNA-binding NtrC family response regulator